MLLHTIIFFTIIVVGFCLLDYALYHFVQALLDRRKDKSFVVVSDETPAAVPPRPKPTRIRLLRCYDPLPGCVYYFPIGLLRATPIKPRKSGRFYPYEAAKDQGVYLNAR